MTNEASIAALLALIRERQKFVVTSHTRPDGDAIGTALGLFHLLEAMGKQATVVFTDPIPDIYQFLPGVERIVSHVPAGSIDAAIFLESGTLERASLDAAEFAAAAPAFTIHIDHHQSGTTFADFNWIDPTACAVGALVYDLAIASGAPISKAIADCLYTAVVTDTGSFNFPGTTASTFAMAQHLVECGVVPNKIAQAVFFSNPPAKSRIVGIVLSRIEIQGSIAWSYLTLDDLKKTGAVVEDCEGTVNQLINIAGVQAAVLLRELQPGTEFRLSLRSKGDIDVSRVAEHFGGGGHRNASGCTLNGTLAQASTSILAALREAELLATATAPEL
jgi:phosphoesterase RecJ-like protein